MKKIVVIALSTVIFSCSSNDKKTTEETKTPNEAGVQNVLPRGVQDLLQIVLRNLLQKRPADVHQAGL